MYMFLARDASTNIVRSSHLLIVIFLVGGCSNVYQLEQVDSIREDLSGEGYLAFSLGYHFDQEPKTLIGLTLKDIDNKLNINPLKSIRLVDEKDFTHLDSNSGKNDFTFEFDDGSILFENIYLTKLPVGHYKIQNFIFSWGNTEHFENWAIPFEIYENRTTYFGGILINRWPLMQRDAYPPAGMLRL